ncbi:hypothetical protein OPQ81_000690 [Rhizoctonia solani]|nr:hypothetical protein OPQ81_000690 [Rhizoctonia solani]
MLRVRQRILLGRPSPPGVPRLFPWCLPTICSQTRPFRCTTHFASLSANPFLFPVHYDRVNGAPDLLSLLELDLQRSITREQPKKVENADRVEPMGFFSLFGIRRRAPVNE